MIKVEREFSLMQKEFFVAVLVGEGGQERLSMQPANDKQEIKLHGD